MTYTLFLVLIMIVAFLLILIIMVQNPKGGGLSSSFGGGGTQSLGGVQNTTNFLDKSTWTLSMVLLVLILLSNFVAPRANSIDTSSEIENTIENREIQDVPTQPATTTTQKDTAQ
ncbi:MAG: preprotein translocase subunit SecG [Lutibacter sp.]|nr:MAG: preprotein translocase subunit SecG [Lutibacter sp.]PHS53517.1 MAG: preprotein translocase subunit SecG [Lutibacter sp.]